jgi:hypothetical protein
LSDQPDARVGPTGRPARLGRILLGAALLLALAWTGALWWRAPRADYHGTGTVVGLLPPPSSLHATRPVIIIHHDPIATLMAESMSMPFIAASTALFQGLRPGDRIAFGLQETPDALLVICIERR